MFGFIIKPFEDILHGITYGVHEVLNIFGKIEQFGEELFESIVAMIKTIKDLFSISKIEDMFIAPFKRAAVMAISSITKLEEVVARADGPSADGIREKLEEPVKAVYAKMKDGINILIGGINDIVERLKDGEIAVVTAFNREVHTVIAMTKSMTEDIEDIKQKIVNKVKVVSSKLFDVKREFTGQATKFGISSSHSVTTTGQHNVTPFSTITSSVKKHLENQRAAMNAAMDFMVILLIGALIGIFMITRSLILVCVVMLILLVTAAVYILIH